MKISRLSLEDPGSYSNQEEITITHMDIHFDVNFSSTIFSGSVLLTACVKSETCTELFLDTRDLNIKKVLYETDKSELTFNVDKPIHTFGSKLSIQLPKVSSKKLLIRVDYDTSPEATALQWLSACQTAGGRHPYVFSQCQADHCRSIIPCQDSCGVKSTYNATVSVPEEFTVLMSAVRSKEPVPEKDGKKTFHFSQTVPIPAYLIAIAVGNLESRKIGPRSHVWAEPEIVEKAEYEFAETDTFLKIAEDICGPYVWKIYDILVLPPSFPFGGMENPCLTFITPTLLVGDRSLVTLVAHEITHSWSGNLVSGKNFEHFWLNEGFTTFIERKIIGRTLGESSRHFSAIGGLKDLREEINTLGEKNPFTKLVVDLTGVGPDDAFSNCPYEKGHTFLFYLEQLLGGAEKFEPFLRSYFNKFKYQSLSTDEFKEYLLAYFKDDENLKSVDWDLWLYSTGMPPVIPEEYDKTMQEVCVKLADSWCDWNGQETSSFSSSDLSNFSIAQIQEFCAILLEKTPLPVTTLKKMNEIYNMNAMKNPEIKFRWICICLRSHWDDITDAALEFATEQGRMKYCRPIFKDLFDWEKTRSRAHDVFKKNQSKFMHVLVRNLNNDYEDVIKKLEKPS